jgi:hypothetical protein
VKRQAQHPGKPPSFPGSYHLQLNSYALAAAAAGVSALALAQKSEARIVYTPIHRVIGNGDSYRLDFTGDGTTDLTFHNKYHYSCIDTATCFRTQSLTAAMSGTNQAVVRLHSGAVAMKPGMRIGRRRSFGGGRELMALLHGNSRSSTPFGSWINVKNRYLGVKFEIKGKIHYGWARLSVQIHFPLTITATLTGYAYETIPGRSIVAGQTEEPDDSIPAASLNPVTPKLATLGMLALGAPALSIWRREESPIMPAGSC